MSVDRRATQIMALALLIGLAIAGAIIAAVGGGASLPAAAAAFAEGAYGSGASWGATVATAVPVLLTGISASIAFRAGVFNLGQPGMFVAGAVAAGAAAPMLAGPPVLNVLSTLVVAVTAGALWAALITTLSRLTAVDVLVISLITNYLADGLATLLTTRVFRDPTALGVIETRLVPARLPLLIEQSSFHAGALLAVAVCVLYWWILNHTSPGHRLRLYGHNPDFAAASGTPRRRYEMHITVVAGAVSGLAGGIQVLGVFLRYIDGSIGGSSSAAWTGMILAILAPLGSLLLIPGALFLASLQTGLLGVEREIGVSSRLSLVVQAIVMIAVAWGRGRAMRAQRAGSAGDGAPVPQPQTEGAKS